ncbi:hypothetical protein Htur_0526 [Haloterrigena turkmenica DSM 5511]|uniref:Uncharacterized protein n=1 Tax=Haloterrigena turkmenica (strain ATCC 51198 / DSM 5511 / JCM 9101 / NCIMB 13204 / VKM B-1734 / 4k) TaxID=543526 RepID=D2RVR0_HALTV|nr:hypothetical protein [Haloterrigena turkmenica]ADB59424.1 hypothetical protein Htur_0526 [Haloterrigena turkmenica DSM 5511]
MEPARETESNPFGDGPLTPTRIGAAAGMMDIIAFTVMGYITFDNITIGAIAGLLVGLGVFCFPPVFMQSGEGGDLEELEPADDAAPLRGFHRVAAGFALSAAGIVVFATGFVELDTLVGIPAALVAAVGIYLVAGFAMPNAQLRT